MTLVLIGDTKLYKTTWARSLGDHWYMSNDFNVDCLKENVKYGVMDDITLSQIRSWKGFIGCQRDITVTDKYRTKRVYKGGLPIIWCSNDDPREEPQLKPADVRWLNGNCVFVEITRPLWEKGAPQNLAPIF